MRYRPSVSLIVMMFVLALVAPIPSSGQKKPAKAAPAAAGQPGLGDFDDFVNQALKEWKVPGAAVAVVQGDKVILLKGYGYRDLEKQLPVTPEHAVCDRLDYEIIYGDHAGHGDGRRQGGLGQAGARLSARVQDVRSCPHRADDDPRPDYPSLRTAAARHGLVQLGFLPGRHDTPAAVSGAQQAACAAPSSTTT